MPLSTEVFVMIIFISGIPFFYNIFHDSGMEGRGFFMLAYIFLALSNCFTVLEEFWMNRLFNVGEHLFITIGSFMMLTAVMRMIFTGKQKPAQAKRRSEV